VLQTLVTAGPNGNIVSGIHVATNDSATELVTIYESNAAYAPGNNYTATVSASQTTVLTLTSTFQQIITGSTSGQIFTLPSVSSIPALSNGQLTLPFSISFQFINFSTQSVTVNATSGANPVVTVPAGQVAIVTFNGNTVATAQAWNVAYGPTAIYCTPIMTALIAIGSGESSTSLAAINILNSTLYPSGFLDAYGNWCMQLDPGNSLLCSVMNTSAAITTSGKTTVVNVNVAQVF
jgi:hypothetical protein